MKQTKRKAFNFLRSYFDVLNEIPEDADKLSFLIAIINKQFLDEDPKDLNFITNLCYESQRHSIESSVKGWKRTSKHPISTNPPTNPPTNPKEEEEKEEEKEKYTKKHFLIDWNLLRTKHLKKPSHLNAITFDDESLFNELHKNYTREDFTSAMVGLFKQKKMPNDNTTMQSNPTHFLKFFNSYLTAFHDTNDMLYGKKEN